MGALWRRWRSAVLHHLPLVQGVLAGLLSLSVIAPAAGAQKVSGPSERLIALARSEPLTEASLRLVDGAGVRLAVARLAADGRLDAALTPGWSRIDLATAPSLGLGQLVGDDDRVVNRLIGDTPSDPARPFAVRLDTASGKRALRCLTEAVYFETGRDSEEAQAAVAQVVLNRVRHPAYPASVCGVVYQGAMRSTGCQFSFTCDGSLKLGHLPSAWTQAEQVARRALSGHVSEAVGTSTNYHADYVAPYWARTVVRITQVGPHIFYRWTGPLGHKAAFTQRYSGAETNISQEVLNSWDWRVQGTDAEVSLKGEAIAPAQASAAVKVLEDRGLIAKVYEGRVRALLNPVPRKPSPEEVASINARMEVIERGINPVKQPPLDGEGE
jgi:hypothetical protein